MKKLCAVLLAVILVFSGCGTGPEQYNATYLDVFDTVTTIIGFGDAAEAQKLHAQLQRYHQLFDIYNDYEGINNLKTVNDQAGIAPVAVDRAIIELLLDCREYYDLTGGKVNVAMGSVLRLWHEARTAGLAEPEKACLPDRDALAAAALHTDIGSVIIDEAASTVYLSDPEMSLDVGAIAKGWACRRAAENAPEGMLLSVGGNVCATGSKNGKPWVIGIQNPDGGGYLQTLHLRGGAVVTSGDYQRAYRVDGEAYHHIIDPETQMPSSYWRSVTVVCEDPALADALSTALFLLPLEEGEALAESCGAEALWMDKSGKIHMTEGLERKIAS